MDSDQTQPSGPLLLTARQVCALLRISRTTLRELENNDVLMPVRIGRAVRYLVDDVYKYIAWLCGPQNGPRRPGRPRTSSTHIGV